MKKISFILTALIVFAVIGLANAATVTDNTLAGAVERYKTATNSPPIKGGTWYQDAPDSSISMVNGKPFFAINRTDTSASVEATDHTAISAYEVLWTPNDPDTLMYISSAAGTDSWRSISAASVVATDTGTNVTAAVATTYTAITAGDMIACPNATNVLFYIARASGTNAWGAVAD